MTKTSSSCLFSSSFTLHTSITVPAYLVTNCYILDQNLWLLGYYYDKAPPLEVFTDHLSKAFCLLSLRIQIPGFCIKLLFFIDFSFPNVTNHDNDNALMRIPKCRHFVFLGCQAFVQLHYVVQEFHLRRNVIWQDVIWWYGRCVSHREMSCDKMWCKIKIW